MKEVLIQEAVILLKKLIAEPSFSKEEDRTADLLQGFLEGKGVPTQRKKNNVWALNQHFDKAKPSILLNSHHDTVRPNKAYTRDPFKAEVKEGKLFGLGSNDAGGCLVSLLATFLYFYHSKNLPYNIIFLASAEEENSGLDGVELVLPELPKVEFAIVGEPTLMDMAIAEKGLLVLDAMVKGKAGHAAREEGENAIYLAMKDVEWFKNYRFPKISPELGPVKMSVTVIEAGKLHNMVPEECRYVVDVRVTEMYSHEEILEVINRYTLAEIKPRSLRMRPSAIPKEHPIVQAGLALGRKTYGSPTTSDQALMPFPSLKMGPGDSARSHSADEFIFLDEIGSGVEGYVALLEGFFLST